MPANAGSSSGSQNHHDDDGGDQVGVEAAPVGDEY